jgi:translation elongation factor EF-4
MTPDTYVGRVLDCARKNGAFQDMEYLEEPGGAHYEIPYTRSSTTFSICSYPARGGYAPGLRDQGYQKATW